MAILKSGAEVSKRMKAELKEKFGKDVKFSVRYSSFRGGDSIDVRWSFGPTYDQVNDVIKKYQHGYFNISEDIYEYEDTNVVKPGGDIEELGGVKYVSAHRNFKTAAEENSQDWIEEFYKPEKTFVLLLAKDLVLAAGQTWAGPNTPVYPTSQNRDYNAQNLAESILAENAFDTSEVKEYQGLAKIKDLTLTINGATYKEDERRFDVGEKYPFHPEHKNEYAVKYDNKVSEPVGLIEAVTEAVRRHEYRVQEEADRKAREEKHNTTIAQLKHIVNSTHFSDQVRHLAQITIWEIDGQEAEKDIKNVVFKRYELVEPVIILAEFPSLNKNSDLKQYKEEYEKDKKEGKDITQRAMVDQVIITDAVNFALLANCLLCNLIDVWKQIGGHGVADNLLEKELNYTPDQIADFDKRLGFGNLTPEEKVVWLTNYYAHVTLVFNEETKEAFVVNTETYNYARYVGFPLNAAETEKAMLAIKAEEVKPKIFTLLDLNLTPSEFFSRLDLTKMDAATADLVTNYLKSPEFKHADSKELSPQIRKLSEYIYTAFPEALNLPADVDAEEVAKQAQAAAVAAAQQKVKKLESRLMLVKKMVAARPKDKKLKARVTLVAKMLEAAKADPNAAETPKMANGGHLDADRHGAAVIKQGIEKTLGALVDKVTYVGSNKYEIVFNKEVTVDEMADVLDKINEFTLDDKQLTVFETHGFSADAKTPAGNCVATVEYTIDQMAEGGNVEVTDDAAAGKKWDDHFFDKFKLDWLKKYDFGHYNAALDWHENIDEDVRQKWIEDFTKNKLANGGELGFYILMDDGKKQWFNVKRVEEIPNVYFAYGREEKGNTLSHKGEIYVHSENALRPLYNKDGSLPKPIPEYAGKEGREIKDLKKLGGNFDDYRVSSARWENDPNVEYDKMAEGGYMAKGGPTLDSIQIVQEMLNSDIINEEHPLYSEAQEIIETNDAEKAKEFLKEMVDAGLITRGTPYFTQIKKLENGGNFDDYKSKFALVDVIFEDAQYNYSTNVSATTTEADARKYFVGQTFNVGSYPKEVMKKAIDIKFHAPSTYENGGYLLAKGGEISLKDASSQETRFYNMWDKARKKINPENFNELGISVTASLPRGYAFAETSNKKLVDYINDNLYRKITDDDYMLLFNLANSNQNRDSFISKYTNIKYKHAIQLLPQVWQDFLEIKYLSAQFNKYREIKETLQDNYASGGSMYATKERFTSLAPQGTVFVRFGSHRTSDKVSREGIPQISFYNFYTSGTAGQSLHLINEADFKKIEGITGVSGPYKKLSTPGMKWKPRLPKEGDQAAHKLYDAYEALNDEYPHLNKKEAGGSCGCGHTKEDGGGLYDGPSHAEGGIDVIIDGVKQVEVEGDEFHICEAARKNPKVFEFKEKTVLQILQALFEASQCEFKQGEAHSGDFIICKRVVLDDAPRSITGTCEQIINTLQAEKACEISSPPNATVHK